MILTEMKYEYYELHSIEMTREGREGSEGEGAALMPCVAKVARMTVDPRIPTNVGTEGARRISTDQADIACLHQARSET